VRSRRSLAAPLLLVLLAGCGGGEGTPDERETTESARPTVTATTTTEPSEVETLKAPPCPGGASNCERASGRILYVERVDPDGDGDAHFVLVSVESITAPGVSVIDVRADLRPDPLPRPGDDLAASGPVYRGSYGQRQIQADRVVVGTDAR
jgi:hypothetical protein